MSCLMKWLLFYFWQRFFCYTESLSNVPRNHLSESILYYEPLDYRTEDLVSNHKRIRRSLHGSLELHLNFNAHSRTFNLRLKRDVSLFTHDLQIEGAAEFHPANIYDGYILNEPSSFVQGFIYDGIFEGRIHTENGGEYHVESVKQYKHIDNKTIHSVIYNVKDIVHKGPHQCGGVRAIINDVYNATIWKDISDINDTINIHSRQRRESESEGNGRGKRSADPDKTECHLHVRADHTYATWANDNNRALYLITQHIRRVSKIYKKTDFDGDGSPDQYTINIRRIGVINSEKFKPKYIGVEKFLDISSLDKNNEKYCLSYVFSHRDFSGGVLGLAWIGGPVGGICDRYMSIGGIMKCLNTGIVSNLNYGKTVPSKVTDVTLAHEIGHNWGSPHDPLSSKCSPGGSDGNFVMYARATSGRQGNNNLFSPCSRASMWKIMQAKARKCFKPQGSPICGNRIKEKGEDCDCGYENEESCKSQQCCIGARSGNTGCKFTAKAKTISSPCTPSSGICCNGATCKPYSKSEGKVCSKASECSKASVCDGASFACPIETGFAADKTLCNNGANTCIDGECAGSLCVIDNKQDCQCADKADYCSVCCKSKGENCTVYRRNQKDERRSAGSPCDNFQGYCDILYKCRKVDAEGPLSRLKKFMFSGKSIDTILDWMKEYWWACILIGLSLVSSMVVFITCCSVHTPSSNPDKPPPRALTIKRGQRSGGSSGPRGAGRAAAM